MERHCPEILDLRSWASFSGALQRHFHAAQSKISTRFEKGRISVQTEGPATVPIQAVQLYAQVS